MTDSPKPDKFDNAAFTMIEQIRKRIWKDLHEGKLNYDSAISILERNAKICIDQENYVMAGRLIGLRGSIELERSEFQEAEKYLKAAIEQFEKAGDTGRIGVSYINLGEMYRRSGAYEKASDHFIRARKIVQAEGNFSAVITTYNNHGQTELAAGNLDKAIELLKQGITAHSDSGQWNMDTIRRTLPEIQISLGEAYARKGDFDTAKKYVDRAMDVAQEFNQVQQIAHGYRTMAFIAMLEGKTMEVFALLDKSREHYAVLNAKVDLARLAKMRGDFHTKQNEAEEAQKSYQQAVDLLEAAQLQSEADQVRKLLVSEGD